MVVLDLAARFGKRTSKSRPRSMDLRRRAVLTLMFSDQILSKSKTTIDVMQLVRFLKNGPAGA